MFWFSGFHGGWGVGSGEWGTGNGQRGTENEFISYSFSFFIKVIIILLSSRIKEIIDPVSFLVDNPTLIDKRRCVSNSLIEP